MSPVTTMVCDNCGDEAAETLVTRARWRAYEHDGGVGYLCGNCAADAADRRGEPAMLDPAVARERHEDDDENEARDDKGIAGRLVEWVVGR
jgi:hypothetical protein